MKNPIKEKDKEKGSLRVRRGASLVDTDWCTRVSNRNYEGSFVQWDGMEWVQAPFPAVQPRWRYLGFRVARTEK